MAPMKSWDRPAAIEKLRQAIDVCQRNIATADAELAKANPAHAQVRAAWEREKATFDAEWTASIKRGSGRDHVDYLQLPEIGRGKFPPAMEGARQRMMALEPDLMRWQAAVSKYSEGREYWTRQLGHFEQQLRDLERPEPLPPAPAPAPASPGLRGQIDAMRSRVTASAG